MQEGARVVAFGNGTVARELIVSVEDDVRRVVWTADLLPDVVVPAVGAMMEQAMPIIKATVERAERDSLVGP